MGTAAVKVCLVQPVRVIQGLVTLAVLVVICAPVILASPAYANNRLVLVSRSEKLVVGSPPADLWFDVSVNPRNPLRNLALAVRGNTELVKRSRWTLTHARNRRPALQKSGLRARVGVAWRVPIRITLRLTTVTGERFTLRGQVRVLRSPTPYREPEATPAPTPGEESTPTATPLPTTSIPSPTATPTATPTPTPSVPPNFEVSSSAVQFSGRRFETIQRRVLVRPLDGVIDIERVELVGDTAISLLAPEEVAAQGGAPCAGAIDRFCVVILDVQSDVTREVQAVLSIEARGIDNASYLHTLPISAEVLPEQLNANTEFRTVSLGAIAAGRGTTVRQLLLDEMLSVRPRSYLAGDRPTFSTYSPSSSAQWARTWFNSVFDFSGIAWDVHQAGTAITRCHVTLAQHYPRGGSIVFHRKNGTRFVSSTVEQRLLSSYGIARDVAIYRISPCLPPDMKVYPLLDGTENLTSALVGSPLINTHFPVGSIRAISARVVGGVSTLLSGGSTSLFPPEVQAPAVSGDSGNPSFLYLDGELILVSQFWTGGFGSGPYLGAGDLQTALRQAIADMPPD